MLRQLATWLGDEAFLRGRQPPPHPAPLRQCHPRRLRGRPRRRPPTATSATWVDLWLRSTGFDTLRVTRGRCPVLLREGSRPHRVRVTAYDDALDAVGSELVDVADEPVPLPAFAGRVARADVHGETFARIVLDARARGGAWRRACAASRTTSCERCSGRCSSTGSRPGTSTRRVRRPRRAASARPAQRDHRDRDPGPDADPGAAAAASGPPRTPELRERLTATCAVGPL